MIIQLTSGLLTETIKQLQSVGKLGREYMVFWSGVRGEKTITIKEVYIPFQITSRTSIRIPEKGMRALFEHLRKNRFMLAAQIHIHPQNAYHSNADDCLAILKHEGALSLVLPWFGMKTTSATFLSDVVSYVFTKDGQWEETNIQNHIELKRQWII